MYELLYMGFGLEIGFIDYLQIVTISNYGAIVISTLYRLLEHTQSLFSLRCIH
jgi:hypothetical protein